MNMSANLRFDFTGQSVLVTGAARGIGRAIGEFFVASGATTYFVDVDGGELKQLSDGPRSRLVTADVANTDEVERVVDAVAQETGRIDVLINNAGILRDSVLWKMPDEAWDDVLDVHAGATFRFVRACVPRFREASYGRVINVTSYSGIRGNIGQANYATAKAGFDRIHKDGRQRTGAFWRYS
jgi:3-oxoacyl-[acyl-carrier protein] reductase